MTTATKPELTWIDELNDEELAEAIHHTTGDLERTKAVLDALQAHMLARMRATGAKWLPFGSVEVKLEPQKSREYDPNLVYAKREQIPEELFNLLYIPEREVTKTLPAKVDGNVANKVRKLGTEYDRMMTRCELPRGERLVVTVKGGPRA
jgi:hypothetical protein